MADTPPDEFASLAEAADELALGNVAVPPVRRRFVEIDEQHRVSLLAWGDGEPELVLLHGGGQNAHTWDLLLLLLGRPAVAVDLPGHGHSSWRADQDYRPTRSVAALATVIEQHAPHAVGVIGMSLGGLNLIHLAATRPDLVRRAVLVDVTPGSPQAVATMSSQQRGAADLMRGPRTFASREEMIDASVRASPRRPVSAVRRGVIHNTRQLPDEPGSGATTAPAPTLRCPSATSGRTWPG